MADEERRAPGEATGVVSEDNDRVRITTWTFTVTDADGNVLERKQVAGEAYLGTEGTDHDVVNSSDHEAAFVEIELKR